MRCFEFIFSMHSWHLLSAIMKSCSIGIGNHRSNPEGYGLDPSLPDQSTQQRVNRVLNYCVSYYGCSEDTSEVQLFDILTFALIDVD